MRLNQLLNWFKSTPAWRRLKPQSQTVYSLLIAQGVALLGPETSIVDIRAENADWLYETLTKSHGIHKATSVCAVLRTVWNVAYRYQKTPHNPFAKMGLGAGNPRTVIWSEEQVNAFVAASVEYGLPSIGLLVVLCYTFGQRPGDIRLLKWSNYDGEYFEFTQQKTGKRVLLAVPDEVKDELSLIPRTSPYIIVREDTNRPYTEDDYLPIFKQVRALAVLPDTLQIRDCRRSATVRMEENGATDADIMNLTGHDRRSTLNHYHTTTRKSAKRAMNLRKGG